VPAVCDAERRRHSGSHVHGPMESLEGPSLSSVYSYVINPEPIQDRLIQISLTEFSPGVNGALQSNKVPCCLECIRKRDNCRRGIPGHVPYGEATHVQSVERLQVLVQMCCVGNSAQTLHHVPQALTGNGAAKRRIRK